MKLSIGGFDFCIYFVVKKETTLQRLFDIAYENNVELDNVGDSGDGDQLIQIVEVGDPDYDSAQKSDCVNGFLKELKKDAHWLQDRDTIGGERALIFYHEETLA